MSFRYLPLACAIAMSLSTAHADGPSPLRIGETFTYNVSWTGYVSAGTATIALRTPSSPRDGRRDYYAVAEVKPSSFVERLYHLYYKAESFMDRETLQPSVATVYSDERGRKRLRTTTFISPGITEVEVRTRSIVRERVTVPPHTQDPLSALYLLRTLSLRPGQTLVVPLLENGKRYQLRALVTAHENVESVIGRMPAWRIALAVSDEQGHAAVTRDLTLWLADNPQRVPLRLRVALPVGSFVLDLAGVS